MGLLGLFRFGIKEGDTVVFADTTEDEIVEGKVTQVFTDAGRKCLVVEWEKLPNEALTHQEIIEASDVIEKKHWWQK